KFAAAGCAVISNSSAFRMVTDVPLVVPEVNADHLELLETQVWRKANGGKGGYIVTNPNCSAIGLVLALKPLEERFGLESMCVSIKFKKKATREEILVAWSEFAPLRQFVVDKHLPTAPDQPVEFDASVDRPQPRLDRMRGNGMAATVGRLRECTLLDWKFVVL